ncbi:MAG: hypothetical protein LBQ30_03640 [Treponema sp.]|nr:hypothetical protein [Treponema sp.]
MAIRGWRQGVVSGAPIAVKRRIIRITVLVCAVLCIIVGIVRGDTTAILRRAVYICLECIGIG